METYIVRIYKLGITSIELVGTVQCARGGPHAVFHGAEELWRRFNSHPSTWPKSAESDSDSDES